MKLRPALLASFSALLLVLLRETPAPLDAHDWIAPPVPVPGLEIDGQPGTWKRIHAKALDPVYDGASGRDGAGDLMGFYFDQEVDRLSFRLNFFRAPGTPAEAPTLPEGVRAFVLLDYQPGGTTALPEGIVGKAPVPWDRAVELTETGSTLAGRVLADDGSDRETERLRRVIDARAWGSTEASLWLPGGFRDAVARAQGKPSASYASFASAAASNESTPIRFYVFTARDGRVLDDLQATNVPASPVSNAHNVAFVQHGNQGLSYTTVFRGIRGENAISAGDPNNPDDGFDEILDAHDFYNLPLNWHMGGLLITAAAWDDPAFNQQLVNGVNAGRYEMISSAYGQQIMPFVRDEINGKSVSVENSLINFHYNSTPRVAWVPERVWVENPDNDGNGITASAGVNDYIEDNFTGNGIWAVILDDYIHCAQRNTAFDDHHIYTYGNGIKILPIDNDFVGQVNNSVDSAWNTILAGTSDEIIIYGNDAEIAAEVSQGAGNASALNNYIWLLQQCANNAATVGVWKLTDVLQDPAFTTQPITLENGTYGLLGGFGGYGGSNNSWYTDYAAYTGPANLDAHTPKWDYGTQWNFALNKLLPVPNNNLREMAWYILLTNLHETGWHDLGQISGWENHYANHIRSANAHAEAARWAGGLYAATTGAFLSDFEDDGTQELVMYNDRLLAVFDPIGGKLQWLFAKGPGYDYSVVSNDNVYWVDTDGDFNETNHVAGLSDVSVGGADKEHETYGFQVIQGTGNNLVACITHPNVTKIVSLNLGDPYFTVEYRDYGAQVFVKSGMSPDLLDLTWNATMDRVWDPDGGGYFGRRNPNTAATAAIVVGAAGATHNMAFTSTLLGGDELRGTGAFKVLFYGGATSPADSTGHIPELRALRDVLADTEGPMAVYGTYYPTSDHLTLNFDDLVVPATVAVTALGIDDNGDGVAEVTLTGSDLVTTTATGRRVDLDLSPASAAAIEALNTATLTLVLGTSALQDPVGNANVNDLCGTPIAAPIAMAPATKIQLDGLVDTTGVGDWESYRKKVEDNWDSAWNGTAPGDTNEINTVLVDWDDTYLYLAVQGFVNGNSWILYLDTDFGGTNGQTDLTRVDTWERGATFSAPGFKPDFQIGAYQHQGGSDSQTMWRFTSDTTSVDLSAQALMAFDPMHLNGTSGGSEIAVPWDVLYGLGTGQVPAGAEIAVVASVCWDPEPNGELGGDVAPNNLAALLPAVDNACNIVVDADGNGLPDLGSQTAVPGDRGGLGLVRVRGAFPNPMYASTRIPLHLAGRADGGKDRYAVRVDVFDLAGRRIRRLEEGRLPAGEHTFTWDGRDATGARAGAGIFFVRVAVDGRTAGTVKITRVE